MDKDGYNNQATPTEFVGIRERITEAFEAAGREIRSFVGSLPADTGRIDGDDPTVTVEWFEDSFECRVTFDFVHDEDADQVIWYAASDFLAFFGNTAAAVHSTAYIVKQLRRDFGITDDYLDEMSKERF